MIYNNFNIFIFAANIIILTVTIITVRTRQYDNIYKKKKITVNRKKQINKQKSLNVIYKLSLLNLNTARRKF